MLEISGDMIFDYRNIWSIVVTNDELIYFLIYFNRIWILIFFNFFLLNLLKPRFQNCFLCYTIWNFGSLFTILLDGKYFGPEDFISLHHFWFSRYRQVFVLFTTATLYVFCASFLHTHHNMTTIRPQTAVVHGRSVNSVSAGISSKLAHVCYLYKTVSWRSLRDILFFILLRNVCKDIGSERIWCLEGQRNFRRSL